MTLKSSFSKYFFNGFKRNLWAISLASLLFILAILLPTTVMLQLEREHILSMISEGHDSVEYIYEYVKYLIIVNPAAKAIIILLAMVCGVVNFSFLHNKSRSDFMLSLPLSREKLFITEMSWAYISILVPYFVIRFITYIIFCGMMPNYTFFMGIGEIFAYFLEAMIFTLAILAISVLSAILCGKTPITFFLQTFIFVVVPVVIGMFILLGNVYLEHFPRFLFQDFMAFVPYSPIFEFFSEMPNHNLYMWIYLFIGVLVTFGALLLFKVRKSETVGSSISFSLIKIPLEILIATIAGVYAALFFEVALMMNSRVWMVIGVILGVLLVHIFMQVAYEYTFKSIFHNKKNMFISLGVAVILIFAYDLDITGFSTRTISADQIESYTIIDDENKYDTMLREEELVVMTENKDKLAELIALGAEDTTANEPHLNEAYVSDYPYTSYMYIDVMVNQTSGGTFNRSYSIIETEESRKLFNEIFYTEENIKNNFAVFNENVEMRDIWIEARGIYLGNSMNTYNTDTGEFKEELSDGLTNAVREDILTLTPEQLSEEGIVTLSFVVGGDSYSYYYSFDINRHYTNTVEFIAENIEFDGDTINLVDYNSEVPEHISVYNGTSYYDYGLDTEDVDGNSKEAVQELLSYSLADADLADLLTIDFSEYYIIECYYQGSVSTAIVPVTEETEELFDKIFHG